MTIYSLDVLLFLFGTSTVLTVASWPAFRFLKRQIRWSAIPISFRIFHFVVIHRVKGYSVISEAEVDVFLKFSCFAVIQWMLAIWPLVHLPFLNPSWTSGSSQFTYCWSLAWRILIITSTWDECNCAVVWAFFGLAFLWEWKEYWPSPVLWPLLSFPNLLAYWVQHFHSIIFQDLK